VVEQLANVCVGSMVQVSRRAQRSSTEDKKERRRKNAEFEVCGGRVLVLVGGGLL
jgi:hypothetical protein